MRKDDRIIQEAYGNVKSQPGKKLRINQPNYMPVPDETPSIADTPEDIFNKINEGCAECENSIKDIVIEFLGNSAVKKIAGSSENLKEMGQALFSTLKGYLGDENPYNDPNPPQDGPPVAQNQGNKLGSQIPEPPSQTGMNASGAGNY